MDVAPFNLEEYMLLLASTSILRTACFVSEELYPVKKIYVKEHNFTLQTFTSIGLNSEQNLLLY
jgi:hypothetical protein